MNQYKDCINRIVKKAPWLQKMYTKHVNKYEKLLPYVFMQEDLPDKIKEVCIGTFTEEAKTAENKSNINMLLNAIEDEIHKDNYASRDLIIAFLKEINPNLEYFNSFREMTGYSTRAILEYIHRDYTIY
jgi:hypothetical protein